MSKLTKLILGGVSATIVAAAGWVAGSLSVQGNLFFDTTNNTTPTMYVDGTNVMELTATGIEANVNFSGSTLRASTLSGSNLRISKTGAGSGKLAVTGSAGSYICLRRAAGGWAQAQIVGTSWVINVADTNTCP